MNVRSLLAAAALVLASALPGCGIASADSVPNCGEWSHPVLVSPTHWGCSQDVQPGRHHHWRHVVLNRR